MSKMSNYIGAIASIKNNSPKYYEENFEQVVADPQKSDQLANLFGEECLPVGINNTFMPVEKGDIHSGDTPNLDKAQYNIKERFSYLPRDDR